MLTKWRLLSSVSWRSWTSRCLCSDVGRLLERVSMSRHLRCHRVKSRAMHSQSSVPSSTSQVQSFLHVHSASRKRKRKRKNITDAFLSVSSSSGAVSSLQVFSTTRFERDRFRTWSSHSLVSWWRASVLCAASDVAEHAGRYVRQKRVPIRPIQSLPWFKVNMNRKKHPKILIRYTIIHRQVIRFTLCF